MASHMIAKRNPSSLSKPTQRSKFRTMDPNKMESHVTVVLMSVRIRILRAKRVATGFKICWQMKTLSVMFLQAA